MPDPKWVFMAWNRVRFTVPATWKLASVDARQLVLTEDRQPVWVLKWGEAGRCWPGTSPEARLTERIRKTVSGGEIWPLPHSWRQALTPFRTGGVQWHKNGEHLRALVLFCQICRWVTVMQFGPAVTDATAIRLLASFADHPDDDRLAWALFDIQAVLPSIFTLKSHRFMPGRFELAFQAPGKRLGLYRWAPAEILLQRSDLKTFGGRALGLGSADLVAENAACATWMQPASVVSRIIAMGRPAVSTVASRGWWRLWRPDAGSRILGVSLLTRRRSPIDQLEDICAHFKVVATPAAQTGPQS